MIATISKEWAFQAAHSNPCHPGECRNVHGHTYRVRVWATGEVQQHGPETGMVVDLARLSHAYQTRIHAVCDHANLNDALPQVWPTTVEELAGWMLETLREEIPEVCRVRVYEGMNAYAEVTA